MEKRQFLDLNSSEDCFWSGIYRENKQIYSKFAVII
jgi:hypothetical protein